MGIKELRKKNRADEIEKIGKKYGVNFRMALGHLFDVGYRNITPEAVAETKVKILREEPNRKGIPVMTADFQCWLLDIALELKQFSLWELLSYVKTDLFIG